MHLSPTHHASESREKCVPDWALCLYPLRTHPTPCTMHLDQPFKVNYVDCFRLAIYPTEQRLSLHCEGDFPDLETVQIFQFGCLVGHTPHIDRMLPMKAMVFSCTSSDIQDKEDL